MDSGVLEVRTAQKRIELLKREAIPNLTVSAYLQRDGFNENVVGARASVPLRVWRDNSGEVGGENNVIQHPAEDIAESVDGGLAGEFA